MIRVLASLGLLTASLGACSVSSDREAASATESTQSSGFFACNGGATQCHLVKSLLADDPGVIAQYHLRYTFSCVSGGAGFVSKLELHVGHAKATLSYGAHDQPVADLVGAGPLQIVDTDPVETSSEFFDAGCDLTFQFDAVPSPEQEVLWSKDVRNYSDRLNDNVAIYNSRLDVESWYDVFVQSPTPAITSVLQQQITNLQGTGREIDKIKARALQGILDHMPKSTIMAPYDQARKNIDDTLPPANALMATLQRWSDPINGALLTSIADARKAIGS